MPPLRKTKATAFFIFAKPAKKTLGITTKTTEVSMVAVPVMQ
jgi:hypothetical protein